MSNGGASQTELDTAKAIGAMAANILAAPAT